MSVELVRLIGERFISRKDVKAIQRADGSYVPARDHTGNNLPMTMKDFEGHLAGTMTMGHYMTSPEGMCKFFAFDIDLTKEGLWAPEGLDHLPINPREVWLRSGTQNQPPPECWTDLAIHLRCLAEGLGRRAHDLTNGLPIAVAYSGAKGLHVYCFTGPIPVFAAHDAAVTVLESYKTFERTRGQNFWRNNAPGYEHNYEIEIFPKQRDMDGKEFGNLMRLPLGVNRKSGQNGSFLWLDGPLHTFQGMDPMAALSGGVPWPKG